jgi:Thioredoxin domain
VLLAYRCALAVPALTATAVEAGEFPQWADRHGVLAVPAVVVDERASWTGSLPEAAFVERLLGSIGDDQASG